LASDWLEGKSRPESNAQLVLPAAGEVDFVTSFQAQPDRSQESLYSAARIKRKLGIPRRNPSK